MLLFSYDVARPNPRPTRTVSKEWAVLIYLRSITTTWTWFGSEEEGWDEMKHTMTADHLKKDKQIKHQQRNGLYVLQPRWTTQIGKEEDGDFLYVCPLKIRCQPESPGWRGRESQNKQIPIILEFRTLTSSSSSGSLWLIDHVQLN